MTQNILHFSLGPVQTFIADARRTRDLWAGSFLISWLAGQAMAALVAKSGKPADEIIVFPEVGNDELFLAITETRDAGKARKTPYVGSLPNRFKANVTGIEEDAGRICEAAIMDAWRRIESAVWSQFFSLDSGFANQESWKIWRRQVDNFWQMNWVQGDEPDSGSDISWLDLRKNWRSGAWGELGAEPGDLCRLMGRFQEISGYDRINDKSKQNQFYDALRSQTYSSNDEKDIRRRVGELNIGKSERLCALALVKRLFPLLDNIEDIIGWRPGGATVNVVNWPSVSYVAAVPWLKTLSESAATTDTENYFRCVSESLTGGFRGETETKLFGLPNERFYSLDGQLLHSDGIDHCPIDDFRGVDDKSRKANRDRVRDAYQSLAKSLDRNRSESGTKRKSPTEFYALILMDGDRVGARVRSHAQVIKKGLSLFGETVKAYFDPHSKKGNPSKGSLIYAGGDDVLAIVPLEYAIHAARDIRQAYRNAFDLAFEDTGFARQDGDEFTLSGAIIFAQYKIPLRFVLEKAHHYLDTVAKEENGRDSLALAALKPGGIAFDWVSSWSSDAIETLQKITKDITDYSSSFLYNMRNRYLPLFPMESDNSSEDSNVPEFVNEEFLLGILVAEYKKEPGNGSLPTHLAIEKVKPLLTIGQTKGRKKIAEMNTAYDFDGSLLARFIASAGNWNDDK